MKKHKKHLIFTIIFFVVLNTLQIWEGKLGIWVLIAAIILFFAFIGLFVSFCFHITSLVKTKFRDKYQLILAIIMGIVISLAIYQPMGIISYNMLYGKVILYAIREGSASCTNSLSLYKNGKFHYQIICFGVTSVTGKYKVSGDTIFFIKKDTFDDFYKYAIFDTNSCFMDLSNSSNGSLKLYNNYNDSIVASDLCIIHNNLFIK